MGRFSKLFIIGLISGAIFTLFSDKTQAHVLFIDKQTNIAAIFHSNPNDDPAAGEASELFFDIQDKNSDVRIPYSGYDLIIINPQGEETIVPTSAFGSTVKAEYIFPSKGLYSVALESQPKYDAFQKVRIAGSLRINRGVGQAPVNANYNIAIYALVAAAVALCVLGIVFYNYRREIFTKSTF